MRRDIVVVGASSGGIEAFRQVLSALPENLPASLFLTIHTGPAGPRFVLPELLAKVSRLTVDHLENDEIRHGRVYVARPNLHLIIKRGHIENRFLPKENMTRPAIDPMFRSAAHSYGRRVIGIVLTGNFDDGAAGLGIIKDEGGLAIVQDPQEARFPGMPSAAIRNVAVDHVVPLAEIAPLIVDLVNSEIVESPAMAQTQNSEGPQILSCPGCGGVLRQHSKKHHSWFECQIGHRYSLESMISEHDSTLEHQLWGVLAMLKQKEEISRTVAADARTSMIANFDPETFEKQAEAAAETREIITRVLSEKGPVLFPGTSQGNSPESQE